MQNAAFAALGLDWVYVPFPVPPERLADAVRGLVALGFAGCNATVPHKPGLVPLMDELTPIAAAIDSVNTIVIRPDGSLLGDSTDGHGFLMDLRANGVKIGDQGSGIRDQGSEGGSQPSHNMSHLVTQSPSHLVTHALVIGAGGAARAVVYALAEAGASVAIVNRTPESAEELCRIIGRALPGADVSAHLLPDALPSLAAEADLIVNTTSLGLHGDADPLAVGCGDPVPAGAGGLRPDLQRPHAVPEAGGGRRRASHRRPGDARLPGRTLGGALDGRR